MANETVLFKRGDSATITSTPVTDGQILFDTSGNGKMYLDNGTDRLEMGGAITVDASLSKTSTNAIQNKAVTGNILNSLAEVSAATQQNTIAGALALKEVNSSLNSKVSNFTSGNYEAVTGLAYDATNKKLGLKVGADTVIPFSGGEQILTFTGYQYYSSPVCMLSPKNLSSLKVVQRKNEPLMGFYYDKFGNGSATLFLNISASGTYEIDLSNMPSNTVLISIYNSGNQSKNAAIDFDVIVKYG